jgi:hypothetical protein
MPLRNQESVLLGCFQPAICRALPKMRLNRLQYSNQITCRGVAQPGSAPALGAGGHRFKSCRPDQLIQNRCDHFPRGMPEVLRLRSEFRLQASAALTPAKRLKFKSCRPDQSSSKSASILRILVRSLGYARDFACRLPLPLTPAKRRSSSNPVAPTNQKTPSDSDTVPFRNLELC